MIRFSQNALSMRTSEIRELMGLATRPDMISFAGGMPNNELFPIAELDEIYANLPLSDKQAGFQYGPTPGYPPLLESLAAYLKEKGLPVDDNGLMITTGSIQAISLVGKVFIDSGDVVLCEDPCFIGAISAFQSYRAQFRPVPLAEDGIDIKLLKEAIINNPNAKVIYLTPFFHNPAGLIYSEARKKEVLRALTGNGLVLLEDDAYGELYFDEKTRPLTKPMKAMGPEPLPICYTGSFSKIFGPGMRLGWLLAPEEILSKCELAKQSADACTSTFNQVLADAFLRQGKLQPYLARLRQAYARRAQIMLTALKEHMPASVTWNTPRGGFYIWLQLPHGMDALEVLRKSLALGAVFVVGKAFDPLAQRNDRLRLAFSHASEERISEGVKIIARAIRETGEGIK